MKAHVVKAGEAGLGRQRLPAPGAARRNLGEWRWAPHLAGWLFLFICIAAQPAGRVATDTKLDLQVNPRGFIAGALHAWTDTFTLGQLQNQAYGYLFPQGAFFALSQWAHVPPWISQRAWWFAVLVVGYSGVVAMHRAVGVSRWAMVLPGVVFALSPHTLATLPTISAETWPTMLSPWVVVALLHPAAAQHPWRAGLAGALPVGLMGAVNATATLAAACPGAVVLGWLWWRRYPGAVRAAVAWVAGCSALSLWWVGPLLVLGRYSPPFTDFIENAFITTRWLNPAEALRGATSWVPFADVERAAGLWVSTQPIAVVLTLAVAGVGLVGLGARRDHAPLWLGMFLLGLAVMCSGWASEGVRGFLDGAGVALRNVHKFDVLVRLPLAVGVGWVCAARWPGLAMKRAGVALVGVVAALSVAPAWSGNLLPEGTYTQIPAYWSDAARFINQVGGQTRTLIAPAVPFARQDWGWTRDEPLQPLLTVPWATRDAVPLVNPEAIRGLDGTMELLEAAARGEITPEQARRALVTAGFGVLVLREAPPSEQVAALRALPLGETHDFGPVRVVVLDRTAGMARVPAELPLVAGGGEAVPWLRALTDATHVQLTDDISRAQVVTDTPVSVGRNYGAGVHGASEPLTRGESPRGVHGRVWDYPSAGALLHAVECGGQVEVSSAAADAMAFGGPQPTAGAFALVDGSAATAWAPLPGTGAGQWARLVADEPTTGRVRVESLTDTRVVVSGQEVQLTAGKAQVVELPAGTREARLELTGPARIAQFNFVDAPISRRVEVRTGPATTHVLLGPGERDLLVSHDLPVAIHLPEGESVQVDGVSYEGGAQLVLTAGHHVVAASQWVLFAQPGATLAPRGPAELVVTQRAANPGLQLVGTGGAGGPAGAGAKRAGHAPAEAQPVTIDAGMQGFLLAASAGSDEFEGGTPAHELAAGGAPTLGFVGDYPYRLSLALGGILAIVTMLCSAGAGVRLRKAPVPAQVLDTQPPASRHASALLTLAAAGLATALLGPWGVALVAATWLVVRRLLFPAPALIAATCAMAAMWLARAPWPAAPYAGDSPLTHWVVLAAVAAACSIKR